MGTFLKVLFCVGLFSTVLVSGKKLLSDEEARVELQKAEIMVRKPKPDVSLDNIPLGVVESLLKLKAKSKCPVIIRDSGQMIDYGDGKKHFCVRINIHGCINNYILRNFERQPPRKEYKMARGGMDGEMFTIDGPSWLIVYP